MDFSEEQQRRLQYSIFAEGQLSMRQFVKTFRKALETQVLGWTPMVDILHTAIQRWATTQMRRLTKEYFNQDEHKTLWC
jgi:hypothetical protein